MAKPFSEIFESFGSLMELLRNSRFQDLLVNYERAKKSFFVGYGVTDFVSSELMFNAEDKYALKPESYLAAFSEFIRRKENEIEAISIVLNKPKDWSTKALNELRHKLKDQSYDEATLRMAHKIVYHKDAVDIISMVKHAAKESEPLLSIEERVNRAISKVTEGKTLSADQQKWMEYIQEHLKQNMTLDENDLQALPVFTDRGGLSRFKQVFGDGYPEIIKQINLSIAA